MDSSTGVVRLHLIHIHLVQYVLCEDQLHFVVVAYAVGRRRRFQHGVQCFRMYTWMCSLVQYASCLEGFYAYFATEPPWFHPQVRGPVWGHLLAIYRVCEVREVVEAVPNMLFTEGQGSLVLIVRQTAHLTKRPLFARE